MRPSLLLVTGQLRSVHSGVGTCAGLLVDGLSPSAGRSFDLAIATWSGERTPERSGVEWIDLGAPPRWDPSPGRFWSLGRRVAARLAASGRRFDVVHCLDARDAHALVRTGRAAFGRLVGTVHDDYAATATPWPWQYWGQAADPLRRWCFRRWQRRVERRTYPAFDVLLANSRTTGAAIARAYGLDDARIRPVTLTVPTAPPAGPPARLDGQPSLLFSGGNFHRKGLDLVVRALPAIRRSLPGVRLHVAGTCRGEPSIRALVRRLGVGDAVVFHGRVPPDGMARQFAGADLFVMPSRTEALGLVYLEAFRAGTPVIAADRGGVTEIVRDGESGLVVPAGSVAGIADAVLALAGDAELRRRVVDGGRAVLAARTPERFVAETLAAYGFPAAPPAAAPAPPRARTMPIA